MLINFGNKRTFDTLTEAYAFLDANNFESYTIHECRYPDMIFYIVEWE